MVIQARGMVDWGQCVVKEIKQGHIREIFKW